MAKEYKLKPKVEVCEPEPFCDEPSNVEQLLNKFAKPDHNLSPMTSTVGASTAPAVEPINGTDLEKYYELKAMVDEATDKLKAMHDKFLDECKRNAGEYLRGNYLLRVKSRKGRVSVDWQRLVKDQIGELKEDEMSPYVKNCDPSLSIEVVRVDKAVKA